MKLSIIILNFRNEDFCNKCINAIQKSMFDSFEYEIVFVDNASNDGSFENIQEKWKKNQKIKFIKSNKNLGYGQGNELGIIETKGEYLLIINPDIEVFENTIKGLIEYLDNHKNVGIIGPRLLYSDGATQDSFRHFPRVFDIFIKRASFLKKLFHKRLAHFLMWNVDFTKPIEVDWIVGACFMTRKIAWEDVGGFDKRFFLFFEDTDLCRKMWTKNWKVVFNPNFKARHHHNRLSDTKNFIDIFRKKTVRIHIASAIKYFWKWMLKKNPRK